MIVNNFLMVTGFNCKGAGQVELSETGPQTLPKRLELCRTFRGVSFLLL